MAFEISVDWGSVCRGLKAYRAKGRGAGWSLTFRWFGRAWLVAWTPAWHEGRGPYLTAGFYFVRVCRGY